MPDSPELQDIGRDQRCVVFEKSPGCTTVPEGVLPVLTFDEVEIPGVSGRRSSSSTGEHALFVADDTIHIDRWASHPATESRWREQEKR